MEPLRVEGRCQTCFNVVEGSCFACSTQFSPFDRYAAVWPYLGAPKGLIKRYKREKRDLDIPLFANYLLVQLERLSWPLPDLIATPPQDLIKRIWRRFDPIGEIGKELSQLIKVPLFKAARRLAGRPSQGSLSKKERLTLTEEDFIVLDKAALRGKRVLILDDVFTTGATLKSFANALWRGSPLSIYGLTLAWVEPESCQDQEGSEEEESRGEAEIIRFKGRGDTLPSLLVQHEANDFF